MIGVTDGERQTPAVNGPFHVIDLGIHRKIEWYRSSVLDPNQAGISRSIPAMAAVDCRIDTDAGQFVHRCGLLS